MHEEKEKIFINAIHILPIEKLDLETKEKLEFNEILTQHKDSNSESMYEITTITIRRTKIETFNKRPDLHNYIYKVSFENHKEDFFFRVSILNKDIKATKSEIFSKNENILIRELKESGIFSYRLEPKDDFKELGRLQYKKNFRYKLIQINLRNIKIDETNTKKLEQFAQLLYSESANISTLKNKINQYHTDTRKIYVFPSATVQLIFHEVDFEKSSLHYKAINSEEKLLQQKLLDILLALSYKLFYLEMSAKVSKKFKEFSQNREDLIEQLKEISDLRLKLVNIDADIFYINPISPTQIERFRFWNLIFQELKIKENRDLVFEQINLLGNIIQELLQKRKEEEWQKWQKKTIEKNNDLLNGMENLLKGIKKVISDLKQVTEEFKTYQESYNEQKEKEEKKEKKKEEERKRKDAFFNLTLTLFALVIGITGANTYFKNGDSIKSAFQLLNNEILLFSIVIIIPSLMLIGIIGFVLSIMGETFKRLQALLGFLRWSILLVTISLTGVVGYPMYKKIAYNYFKHLTTQNKLVSKMLNFFNSISNLEQKEIRKK